MKDNNKNNYDDLDLILDAYEEVGKERERRAQEEKEESKGKSKIKHKKSTKSSKSSNNDETNKGKKKRKKKRTKSFIMKTIETSSERHPAIQVLYMIVAIPLDILRIIKNIILWLLFFLLIGGAILSIIALVKIKPVYDEYNEFADTKVKECDKSTFRFEESTFIYDKNGDQLVKLRGDKDASYLEYEDIPVDAINAFIAVEDRSFWDNHGIDIKGLVRVSLDAVKTNGEEVHGASTITQQLARNIFLTHEVSIERKAKEMLIAMKLTDKFTKSDIMEFYVNDVCFANAFYGLESASRGYFNKPSSELSLSQITYLCAIPNSPEYYNPYKYPKRALKRRNKILKDMYELNYITKEEYKKAKKEKIKIVKPENTFNNYLATYAIECSTKYMMETMDFEFRYTWDSVDDYNKYQKEYNEAYDLANTKLVTGGYKIYTTLDPSMKDKIQSILDQNLAFDTETNPENGVYALQGAITVIDNETGKVVALTGGRTQESDKQTYSFNRAYQSHRQPGSSIKPIAVYTPALMQGFTPETTVYDIDVSVAKEKGVDVQSLRGDAMTLREALERSKNGVAWQTFNKLGADYCLKFLTDMNFSDIHPEDYYDSASLGGLTHGVTPVEMAGAYSTLENHGSFREPTCIDKIIIPSGEDIYKDKQVKQVYDEKASDTIVDMMQGVITNGTASKLQWYDSTEMVAACKTGTTNDNKDGWLVGFTPYYTVSVWIGYDQPRTMDTLYGNTYPGEVWKQCMLSLIEGKEIKTEFTKSNHYTEEDINKVTQYTEGGPLPEYSYDLYLPGRPDQEELSPGYTVYDYRRDRVIGESVTEIIGEMHNLNKNDSHFQGDLTELYQEGIAIIDSIYSQKYTQEMQEQLNSAYQSLIR